MRDRLGKQSVHRDAATLKVLMGGGTVSSPTDHGTLTGLTDDDHSQYMHNDTARTVTAQHSFAPSVARAPFTLGAKAQDQKVTGFDADSVDGYDLSGTSGRVAQWGATSLDASSLVKSGTTLLTLAADAAATLTAPRSGTVALGAGTINQIAFWSGNVNTLGAATLKKSGAGMLTLANGADDGTITFAAFGTAAIGAGDLSVSSTGNVGTVAHVHTMISSSNPGAAASLLATDTNGALTLADLTVTADLTTSRVDGHLIPKTVDTYDLGASNLLWRKGWLSELEAVLFVENTIQLLGGWFWIPKDAGVTKGVIVEDTTQIDFGRSMTLNDIVVFRSSLQVEYMKIGPNISGNIYGVTRNLDGSGANIWPQGSPYAVLGNSGDGRIELNAYDSPRIQIITQGTVYNQQTEVIRLGDLNGNWGYTGTAWGIGIGKYDTGLPNLTYDTTNGLRIRSGATDRITMNGGTVAIRDSGGSAVFTFDAAGGAEFTKPLTLGTGGGIYQGVSGSFASPGTGLKIWNNSGDGNITAYQNGTATVTLDSNGISVNSTTAYSAPRAYKFLSGGTVASRLYNYVGGSVNGAALTADYLDGKDSILILQADGQSGGNNYISLAAGYHGGSSCELRVTPNNVQVTDDFWCYGTAMADAYKAGTVPGISGTVTLAKLTAGGANGTIVYKGGIVTSVVSPT